MYSMIYASCGICNDEPINLVKNVNILQKGTKICKTFKDYLVNITDELNIYNWGEEDVSCYSKLTSQMSVFNNHPIIRLNKYKYRKSFDFKFEFVSTNQVSKYTNEIDFNKSSGDDLPAKIIKMAEEERTVTLTNCINKCISLTSFPDNLKLLILCHFTESKMLVIKLTFDQLVYYQLFQNIWKGSLFTARNCYK